MLSFLILKFKSNNDNDILHTDSPSVGWQIYTNPNRKA